MKDYYRNTIATISADMAAGDDEGFLETPRASKSFQPIKVPFRTGTRDKDSFLYIRAVPEHDNHNMPLSKRAWVLQEHILSSRGLHCCSEQLVWECQKYTICETNPTPDVAWHRSQGDIKRFFLVPNPNDPDWHQIVAEHGAGEDNAISSVLLNR
jgi:hypothetical protein